MALRELSRGCCVSEGRRSLHASDNTFNFIDLNDDVFGNARLRGTSIDHLDKGDAIIVALRDSHLAEYLVFVGYDDAVEISRNIILPAI